MIFATSQSSQIFQRQSESADPTTELFFDDLVGEPSFRETLMSSALAHDFSFNEGFEDATNPELSFHVNPEGLNALQNPEVGFHLADRFDMTGIFGHSHATSNTSANSTEIQSLPFTLPYAGNEHYLEQMGAQIETATHENISQGQRAERVEQSLDSKKITSLKKVQISRSSSQLVYSQKQSLKAVDLTQLLEGDGMSPLSGFSTDGGDGANEVLRSSVKSPMQSLLNTTSSHAHSNQLLVALQTLENGLRLYTRVQNMSSQEKAELQDSARVLLIENGFFETEIVIDEFSPHINQRKEGGE